MHEFGGSWDCLKVFAIPLAFFLFVLTVLSYFNIFKIIKVKNFQFLWLFLLICFWLLSLLKIRYNLRISLI